METEMIPVVIRALGVIKKGLEKYIDRIPETTTFNELQKNHSSENSSHPQKESFNQVNSLVPEIYGLDLVLQSQGL